MPETIDLTADDNGVTAEDDTTSYGFVHFAVMGNPQAQKRARRGRHGFYSPNKKAIAAFQAQVKLRRRSATFPFAHDNALGLNHDLSFRIKATSSPQGH